MRIYKRKKQTARYLSRKIDILVSKFIAERVWAIGILNDDRNLIREWLREGKIKISLHTEDIFGFVSTTVVVEDTRLTPEAVIANGATVGIALSSAILKVENVRAKYGLPMLLPKQIAICAEMGNALKDIDLRPNPMKHGFEKAEMMRQTAQQMYHNAIESAKAQLYALAVEISNTRVHF